MRIKIVNYLFIIVWMTSFIAVKAQYETFNPELTKLLSLIDQLAIVLNSFALPKPVPVPPTPAPLLQPAVEKVLHEKMSPQKIEEFRTVIQKEQLEPWFDKLEEPHIEAVAEIFNKTTPGSLAGLVEIAQPQLRQELTPIKLGKFEQAVAQDPELVNILAKLTPDQINKFIETYKKTTGSIGNIARALLPEIETKISIADLKKIENVLTQRPDLIEVLSKLTEEQLNQLIDAVKNNQNIDEILEKIKGEQEKVEEEQGEVPPPPPPPWEGGDVPPPPPPPGPAPIPQPKKIGLTAEELAKLTADQKTSSDNVLQELVNKLGFVHTKDLKGYRQTIDNELKKIGASKGAGAFKFKDDNLPTALEQSVKKFVDEKIIIEGEQPEQTINRIKGLSADQNLMNEFAQLFKPWVLGDFNDFAKNMVPATQGIFINVGAAARKALPLIDLGAVDPNSEQAQKSDEQFVMVFEQAPTYDSLLENLNRLRLDLAYLKVDTLEEDFVKKQRAKGGDAEAEEDIKKALERQIRERAGQQEGGQKVGGSSTIFDALEQSDTSATLMSKTDWPRYLFAVINFDQLAQQTLPKFIAQVKEKKKKEPIKPDVPQKPFVQYVDIMANQSKSLKEFFDAIRAITKNEFQIDDGRVMVPVPEGLIKRGTYITFSPDDMKKFIAALPDLKRATLATNAEQRLISSIITQMGILFKPGLSAVSQQKLNKIASLTKGYSDIGQAFVKFFEKIGNSQNLTRAEKIEKITEWYKELEKIAEQKDFENQIKEILSLLISVERTPKKMQQLLEPFISRIDTDQRNRLFGVMGNIILPYGSLSSLIKYYNGKLLVTTNERERMQLLNEFKEALQELNDKNAVSNVDLARTVPLGVNANESYKGNLTLLINALNQGNVDHFISFLQDSFFDAGLKVADAIGRDDAKIQFNALLDTAHGLLAKIIYPTIRTELENIKNGTAKIPGLIAKDRATQALYRLVYEQYNKFIGNFLTYISKLNVSQVSEKLNSEIANNFDEFGKKWIDATVKAMEDAKIDAQTIEEVKKNMNNFIVSIKDRFSYLVKK